MICDPEPAAVFFLPYPAKQRAAMESDSVSTPTGSPAQSADPRPAKWHEPVPFDYRRKRALIAIGIGIAIALTMLGLQIHNAAPLDVYWVDALPIAIGVLRYSNWMKRETVIKYAEETIAYSREERIAAAAKPLGIGVVVSLAFVLLGLADSGFYFIAGFVMMVASTIALVAYLRREESTLTPEGRVQFEADRRYQEAHSPEYWETAEAFVRKRLVRYPLSALLIWYAYTVSQNPKVKTAEIVVLVLIALVAAYEVALWVIGIALVIGLGSLLFQGIAALPVSVAVIIGALIVASSVRDK